MRYSDWPDGSMPVYVNPTFDELKELAETQPDTLRICEDEEITALASGYGNTHDSVIKMVRAKLGIRRWHPVDFILFQAGGDWWYNPVGHWEGASEKVHWKSSKVCLESRTKQACDDFISLYNERWK